MMSIPGLAVKSLRNRKFTVVVTLTSIALSVTLLLGVERIRNETRNSFTSTISGTDLIVGARSGQVQLLLYSIFHIGNATNNIEWHSYRDIADNPAIRWTIPISLGDSHRGYRVLGTNQDYFEYFRFARDRGLEFSAGQAFEDATDAVLGAEVAEKLGYSLGYPMVNAHGAGDVSFMEHDDKPFRVAGILKRTGTPVDQTIHVRLDGIDAIHKDWQGGAQAHQDDLFGGDSHDDEAPGKITAFLVGLRSRGAAVGMLRTVNDYAGEPLTAIMPGVALQELWGLIAVAERALLAIAAFVVIVGLSGMLTALLTSLNERRREMAILRSVGARPIHVMALIMGEAVTLTLAGVMTGLVMLYGILATGRPLLESRLGLYITIGWPTSYELILIMLVIAAGTIIGLVPGYRIYRYSLADGMTVRI
jgi:putative ABC transport system permease protein